MAIFLRSQCDDVSTVHASAHTIRCDIRDLREDIRTLNSVLLQPLRHANGFCREHLGMASQVN